MNPARILITLAAASLLAACAPMNSGMSFGATLSGANERPTPVQTGGVGAVTATLDGTTLNLNLTFSGLSGNALAGHIHGPADKESAAGVLFPFKNVPAAPDGTFTESVTLTDAQIQELRDGKYYVNFHTAANPSGEIRGQLEAK